LLESGKVDSIAIEIDDQKTDSILKSCIASN